MASSDTAAAAFVKCMTGEASWGRGMCFRNEEMLVKRKMHDYIRHAIEDAVLMHTCSSVPVNRQTGLKEGLIPTYRPLEGSIVGSEDASPLWHGL